MSEDAERPEDTTRPEARPSVLRAFSRALNTLPLPNSRRLLMSARRFSPPRELGWMVALFPVIGALEGVILAGTWEAVHRVWPSPIALAIVWAVALWIEWYNVDGMADTADALFQRRKPSDALRIFKGSTIGVLACLVVVTTALGRYVGLGMLPTTLVLGTVMSAPVLAQWARAVALFRSKPAYEGSHTAPMSAAYGFSGLAFSAVVTAAVAVPCLGVVYGASAFVACTVTALVVRAFGLWRLEGIVGDVLGLAHQLSWLAVLLVLTARC